MAKKQSKQEIPFDNNLILFKYFLNLIGETKLQNLSRELNDEEYIGLNDNSNTKFLDFILNKYSNRMLINAEKLIEYDNNICRYVRAISKKRNQIYLKYFQYIGLLFTEIYLDKYFHDRKLFINELNLFLAEQKMQMPELKISEYNENSLNKLCFMCATGSGKTHIMHINIKQYLHYYEKTKKQNTSLSLNKIILLTPNEGLSAQHLEEFELAGIDAALYEKNGYNDNKQIIIVDINKLKEEEKVKTVAVDAFESNNLVLVDEGHRGLSGDVWYDYRNRLSSDGFSFEYSATFKQAIKAANKQNTPKLMDEYGKAIIMDYSYKYFYGDGYGKDYSIYNFKENITSEQKRLYLTGCLLSFYQQMKVFEDKKIELIPFMVEKPLMIFVGSRVTKSVSAGELTDIERVLVFINDFTSNPQQTINDIESVLKKDIGILNNKGNELFQNSLHYIANKFNGDYKSLFADVLRLVFNSPKSGKLYITDIKQVSGEIALKISDDGENFGVVNVGDSAAVIKNCETKGFVTSGNEFENMSLFQSINGKNSKINILIGSKKFTEGWNSYRVSTMGLINFAKGEGSQAIQLFGRGVRLKGFQNCLKRSGFIKDKTSITKDIKYLEKLMIFGIEADYMDVFRSFLETEGVPSNEDIYEWIIPTVKRLPQIEKERLKILKLEDGKYFKKQGMRLILTEPKDNFLSYIRRNKIVLDCYPKVQSIESIKNNMIEQTEKNIAALDPQKHLPFLDYNSIYVELQRYKNEKVFYNICIDVDNLNKILTDNSWYTLLIPVNELNIDNIKKITLLNDIAVMLLQKYIEKFFRYYKAKWESQYLVYGDLNESDENFADEYTIAADADDDTAEAIDEFVKEIKALLNANKPFNKTSCGINIFDFRNHLYAPLIAVKSSGIEIKISPVALNDGEQQFVALLDKYCEQHKDFFNKKELYLLRNKSKGGVGFFDADNFYPDFIMWIVTDNKQYISFIDPKGLRNLNKQDNNAKIELHETIKEIEERLKQKSKPKTDIILNSFVLSITPYAEIEELFKDSDKIALENKHVLFLEDGEDCIKKMIEKVRA